MEKQNANAEMGSQLKQAMFHPGPRWGKKQSMKYLTILIFVLMKCAHGFKKNLNKPDKYVVWFFFIVIWWPLCRRNIVQSVHTWTGQDKRQDASRPRRPSQWVKRWIKEPSEDGWVCGESSPDLKPQLWMQSGCQQRMFQRKLDSHSVNLHKCITIRLTDLCMPAPCAEGDNEFTNFTEHFHLPFSCTTKTLSRLFVSIFSLTHFGDNNTMWCTQELTFTYHLKGGQWTLPWKSCQTTWTGERINFSEEHAYFVLVG